MSQVALESWRDYKPLAFLAPLPQELAERAGLTFRDSHDDLDLLKESAFSGAEGTVFGLVSHMRAPVPGTQLLVHEEDLAKGPSALVGEALDALHLSEDRVRWVAELQAPITSNRVFLSLSTDEHSRQLERLLRRELARHGFETIVAEDAVVLRARTDTIRELIQQCSHVIVAGRGGPSTTYELGIANALKKNIWKWTPRRFVRVPASDSLESILGLEYPSLETHRFSYLTKLRYKLYRHRMRFGLSRRPKAEDAEAIGGVKELVSALEKLSSQ